MRTERTGRLFTVAGGLLLAASLATTAGAGERLTVSAGGGLPVGSIDWTSRSSWDAWAETATLESRHQASSGLLFHGALGVRFSEHFGLVLAVGHASRDTKASIEAQIPHPLYLESPRTVTAELSGLSYTELAFHLDLEWRMVTGPFEIAAFAGPTLARVDTDVASSVNVTETYPFREAGYESAAEAAVTSDLGFGLNAGASATWLATSHLDFGVEARYVRASVHLAPAGGEGFDLTAGGVQLAARLRARF